MEFSKFVLGCSILAKYYDDNTQKYPLRSGHELISFEATKLPIQQVDFDMLVSLGWVQEDWDDDNTTYLPDSEWIAYI